MTRTLLARALVALGVFLLMGSSALYVAFLVGPGGSEETMARPPESSPAAPPPAPPVASPVVFGGFSSLGASATDESRKNAITHWNAGIIYFQKGDYDKARDEWALCRRLDPANGDCTAGLMRIEQAHGASGRVP